MSKEQKALMELIRPALAHLTISRALLEISIDILDWASLIPQQHLCQVSSNRLQ